MEFHEYAAQEVSALIDRLVSDAEARTEAVLTGSQREHDAALSSLRAQFETRGRELAERIRETEQLTAAGEETQRSLRPCAPRPRLSSRKRSVARRSSSAGSRRRRRPRNGS